MGLFDRVREFAADHMADPDGAPNLARRATQIAGLVADAAADRNTAAAAGISLLGAAAVVGQRYVYPDDDYATFTEEPKKRGWRR
ncbi:hypothetical protein [Streptomyces sp. NPDC051909]|uniref:hypothetical protein n=1 Tax=Streptomyces sp. NPDC051909 TaxID=3154944 RepID=UPI00343DD84C